MDKCWACFLSGLCLGLGECFLHSAIFQDLCHRWETPEVDFLVFRVNNTWRGFYQGAGIHWLKQCVVQPPQQPLERCPGFLFPTLAPQPGTWAQSLLGLMKSPVVLLFVCVVFFGNLDRVIEMSGIILKLYTNGRTLIFCRTISL